MKLMMGTNVTAAADPLRSVDCDYFVNSLRNPKPKIASLVRQLRLIHQIDLKAYSQQKRQLPYVLCGTFNPATRRTDHFAHTSGFILDIDHLSQKELDPSEVRRRLVRDPRVAMCFVSPSQDGLKVMFRLAERCYDAGLYSAFYKAFAQQYSVANNLEQVIDSHTCDVTRACFVSVDPDVYYNPQCEPVDMQQVIDTTQPQLAFDLKRSADAAAKQGDKMLRQERKQMGLDEPEDEVMAKIRSLLNPGKPKPAKPEAYVPVLLNEIEPDMRQFVEQTGIQVTEISNIQYGKRIHAKLGKQEGEVNLFYGKRGFTLVKCARHGTTAKMNELLHDVVQAFVDQLFG